MKLYVSGPMTGIKDFNYPAFHVVKQELEEAGHEVVSPADIPLNDEWEWIDYMMVNIASMFEVEGVALLPGWEQSKGVKVEVRIAECRKIPVKPWKQWLSS